MRRNTYKAVIPIVSGVAYIANPEDLAGRHIPDRYLEGLPPALQKQRIRELTESRDAYWKGDYSELPTDRAARKMGLVKESAYTQIAKERGIAWRGDATDMAQRVLRFYGARGSASEVQKVAEAIQMAFKKGLAAWKSGGHRPGATAQNWAVARVNSLVVGGKAAWTADKKQFATLPAAVRKKITDSLDEVLSALHAQGRQRDVAYLAVMKTGSRANPIVQPKNRERVQSLLYKRLKPIVDAMTVQVTRRTSSSIGADTREELAQGALEAGLRAVINSPIVDDADFSGGGDDPDLSSALNIARFAANAYLVREARAVVDPAPVSQQREKSRLESQKRVLRIALGREPTKSELASTLKLTTEELQHIESTRLLPMKQIGLDAPVRRRGVRLSDEESEEEALSEVGLLEDTSAPEEMERLERHDVLQRALQYLTPAEQNVVRAYLGDIPTSSLGFNYEEIERMVVGGYDRRAGRQVPGLRRKIATIVRRELGVAAPGLKELPAEFVPLPALTKKNR